MTTIPIKFRCGNCNAVLTRHIQAEGNQWVTCHECKIKTHINIKLKQATIIMPEVEVLGTNREKLKESNQ